MVVRFFCDVTTDRSHNGVCCSMPDLTAAIKENLAVHRKNSKAVIWTAKAQDIWANVIRANGRFSSEQNEALY
jgi:hypothetical protein